MSKVKKAVIAILAALLALILAACIPAFTYLPRYFAHKRIVCIPPGQGEEITIMSANVRCWSPTDTFKRSWWYRAELLMNDIESVLPDIVGFQEVTAIHRDYLSDCLRGYDHVILYRDDTTLSEACPIFYNTARFTLEDSGSFWLSETPDVMSKYPGAACYRVCTYVVLTDLNTGKKLAVFNTHLDHVSDEARIAGINVILDRIRSFDGVPAVIMGDLNCGEGSETYKTATAVFDDAKYRAADSMTGATYQKWGEYPDRENIDYFLISKTGISPSKYRIIDTTYDGAYPSDHFPIVMKCEISSEF